MYPVRIISPNDDIYVKDNAYYEIRLDIGAVMVVTPIYFLHKETDVTKLITNNWVLVNDAPAWINIRNFKIDRVTPPKKQLPIVPNNYIPDSQAFIYDGMNPPVKIEYSNNINNKDQWKKEGKCPQCGELGHFVRLQPVCSKHGPY